MCRSMCVCVFILSVNGRIHIRAGPTKGTCQGEDSSSSSTRGVIRSGDVNEEEEEEQKNDVESNICSREIDSIRTSSSNCVNACSTSFDSISEKKKEDYVGIFIIECNRSKIRSNDQTADDQRSILIHWIKFRGDLNKRAKQREDVTDQGERSN